MSDVTTPIRILTVCTGNICRSPYAELLLQHGLDSVAPGEFVVGSAGTMGLNHKPIQPPMDQFLQKREISHEDFESRRLSARLLSLATVVLPLTAEHRDDILKMSPASLKRTFTLLEFAAVAEELTEKRLEEFSDLSPEDRWRELVRAAALLRPTISAALPSLDIEDPYRQSDEVFASVAGEIEAAVDKIVGFERAARAAAKA